MACEDCCFAIQKSTHLCLDETKLHAQVCRSIVTDYVLLLLVEVLQVEDFGILNRLQVSSSLDPLDVYWWVVFIVA